MKFLVLFCRGVAASLLMLACQSGWAADAVLAEAGSATVSASDVQGDALRFPVESRKGTLAKADNVKQLADNLVIRRVLASQAQAAGLANDAAVQGALRVAHDRVLSDMLLARMDAANKPDAKTIDALALATYNSNPKRFETPEETGARHILIKRETPNAKAKAGQILAELKAGADFAKLAKEQSQDSGSAAQGGDLGYFAAGRMVAPFEVAVAKLTKPGDLSDVVETQFGYHIIQLEGRRPAGVRPFDEVKEALRREVEAKVLNDKRLAEVQKIRDTVQYNQAAIEELAASYK